MDLQNIVKLIKDNLKIDSIDIVRINCSNNEKQKPVPSPHSGFGDIDYPDFGSFTDR